MTHRKALLFLALTATLWSTGGILIKSVQLHPLAIAGLRSLIGGILMILVHRFFSRKQFHFVWTRAQWGAAISFALTVLLFVAATKLTTAANAIFLQYTAPIYVALLSVPLLKEKVTAIDWTVLVAIVGGMLVFFAEEVSPEHLAGNLIAIASGISFAGIAICLRLQKGKSTFESIILGHFMTAIVGAPFLLMGPLPTGQDLGLIAVLGVFQLGLPYILYGYAIAHVTALEATLVPVIEPILNPVWVAVFRGETPSRYALIGGGIVLTAVLIHSLLKLKMKGPRAEGSKRG